jgi:hypothetical protein
MQTELPARLPFSLPAVVRSHGWIQLAPFETLGDQGAFRYVDLLSSGKVVDLRLSPTPSGVSLSVGEDLLASELQEIQNKLAWMLGLDQDFSDFYALASREPKLASVVEQARGRILRSPTFFEDVIKTILTTNTAWGGTKRMVSALVDHLGSPLPSEPGRRAFPSPSQVALLDEDALRNRIRLGYRVPGPGGFQNQRSAHPRAARPAARYQGRRRLRGCQPAHAPRALRLPAGRLLGYQGRLARVV